MSQDLSVVGFKESDSLMHTFVSAVLMLLLTLICIIIVSLYQSDLPHEELWLTIGVIGFWRYSWKSVHGIRAIYYQTIRFPKLREIAQGAPKPSELLIIVPSFRTKPLINYRVYKKLFDEIDNYGVKTRVASCITDPNDIELVEKAKHGKNIEIYYLPQSGEGKRVAMVEALQLFYQQGVKEDAQLLLMDGDTLLSDDIFHKTCSFLSRYKDLGAVTCHNRALVAGSSLVRHGIDNECHKDIFI